jgi:hypothetical protein
MYIKGKTIFTENAIYVFEYTSGNNVFVKDQNNNSIELSKEYVADLLDNSDSYSKVVKSTKTELSDLLKTTNTAMSVYYTKQGKVKPKKQLDAEIANRCEVLKQNFLSSGVSALADAFTNPVLKTIPGEKRLMVGVSTGVMDNHGRYLFIDMENSLNITKQIDPRTIEYVLIKGVKYVLK